MSACISRRRMLLGSVAACVLFRAGDLRSQQKDLSIKAAWNLSSFAQDDGFDLQVRKGNTGTIIRITGDVVIIDRKRLSSIIATPSTAKTKIQSLTFDARLLILRGPLSLEGGTLALMGETIRFEKGAQIALLPPVEDALRRLTVMADSLEFAGSSRRPFDLNIGSSPKVEAGITVREITGVEATRLWTRFVDSVDLDTPPTGVNLVVGSAADPTLGQAFQSQMEWPLLFAAKVRKHFNRNPFDPAARKEIGAIVDQYLPQLGRWRDPGPHSIVAAVGGAIRGEVDLQGHGFSFTPKQDLNSQKHDLEKAVEGDRFDTLATIIAATSKDDDLAGEDLKRVRAEIAMITQQQSRLERSVDQHNQNLQVLLQQNASTDQLIANRTRYLELMQEREFKRLKDAQSVKQWSTVAASLVVIAASMGAATPAVAAGAAAGLAVTGEAIYRHNIGQPMTLADAIESGAKAYAAAQAFQDSWQKLKADKEVATQVYDGKTVLDGPEPPAGKPDERKPITKVEATKRVLSGLSDAVQKASAINGKSIAAPTPLSLTERQNEDEEMKALVARRAAAVYESQLIAAQMAADVKELESLLNRRLVLQALDVSLREAKPENDQQNARWNANARILWGMNVERISRMVATYKKSLYFESGRAPDGVPDVLDYPNELESQVAAGVLDPYGGFGQTDLGKSIKERLEVEKAKFIASVKATLDAVEATYTAYLNTRTEADVRRRSVSFESNSPHAVERAFLQSLNGQIRQQIVGGAPVHKILPAYIPYTLPPSLNPEPERLLRATVVAVEFNVNRERIGSNSIEFSLIHPGYGEMARGNDTFVADLRTTPTDWKYFGIPAEQITKEWLSRAPTVVEISKDKSDRFYTYYPARAPYFMVVNVHSHNWRALPEIRSIEIGFEVMQ